MGLFELFEAKARADSEEQAGIAKLAKDAEPLVASLLPGRNYFTPREFIDLAAYLLEDTHGEMNAALESGRFSVGNIDIVRHKHAGSEWLSARQIASMSGYTPRHISTLLNEAGVARRRDGKRILYCFAEIKSMNWLARNDTGRETA